MSSPRPIFKDTTYLVTRRCTQRQFLLRPSEKINQIILYCLATAATKYNILVHVACFLSNHYHLVVTDKEGNIPAFLAYLNKYIAKCANAEHGRWENLFAANEKPSLVRLAEAYDMVSKSGYAVANPVLSELVNSPEKWPGVLLLPTDSDELDIDVARPEGFFRPNGPMPERAQLKLTAPETFSNDTEGFISALTDDVTRRVSEKVGSMKDARRKFMGARKVLRQRPTDCPRTREPRRKLSPRVAAKNKWARIEMLKRLDGFVDNYRKAWARWMAGDTHAEFPKGTYALARNQNVRVRT
jgi:putative transposase